MSLVVAYKKDGIVYMGADTQVTSGNGSEKVYCLNRDSLKIKLMPSGILMGRSGKVNVLQHIWAHPEWFTVPEDGVLTKRHVVNNIVPKIYHHFTEHNLFENDGKEDPLNAEIALLLAHKDKLFRITSRLGVTQIEHCVAIGSGTDFVLYGLERPGDTPIPEHLKKMLALSAECCPSVGGISVLADTATNKIKIMR